MGTLITNYYKSPLGTIVLQHTGKGLCSLFFSDQDPIPVENFNALDECKKQLDEYFAGNRREFEMELDLTGTDFQKSVWKELMKIKFGQTISYSLLAAKLGNIKAIRAVANANSKNPVSIVVPCHRIIGADGNLTGYAGGLWRKKWLLVHEQKHVQINLF